MPHSMHIVFSQRIISSLFFLGGWWCKHYHFPCVCFANASYECVPLVVGLRCTTSQLFPTGGIYY